MTFYTNTQRANNADLNMYDCGTQDCEPGHDHGPAVRDHYLIHYISGGNGKFCIGDKTYHLQGGQGFLICPGIVTYYQADLDSPWSYSWVGFNGLKASQFLQFANLSADSPIFSFVDKDKMKQCILDMITASSLRIAKEIRIIGCLHLFLSYIIEENGIEKTLDKSSNRKEQYLQKAIEFVEMNYSRKIGIRDIARHTGLDRSYMGSIFKQLLNLTPQEFLIEFRINKACEFINDENLAIGDISRSVGYDDPLLFSKVFKKLKNMPPRDYRKLQTEKSQMLQEPDDRESKLTNWNTCR